MDISINFGKVELVSKKQDNKKIYYKEEANKLKEKRNLPFKYVEYYSEMVECNEEELSKQCENLKEYQEAINESLDELENQTFEDEWDLEINYQKILDISYGLNGIFYEFNKGINWD